VVVYIWQAGHPGLMPPVLVASVGLAIDALTYGPLGYWPLIFLAGMAVARAANRVLEGAGRAGVWLAFVAASLGLAVVAWLTASAYFFQMVDWRPMALTVAIQALAYPMLAALLAPLERIVAGPRVLNLGRRGP
jgi:rod shape-determining protein MreD